MVAGSVNYEVPGMMLIPQDQSNACWYAAALMLMAWREANRPEAGNASPGVNDDETVQLYRDNNGLLNEQVIPFAKRIGLVAVPPQSPSIAGLLGWLQRYGPLWVNGVKHIVVIAGVRGSDATGYEAKVYDPARGVGIGWRSIAGWYAGANAGQYGKSTRDTALDVKAVFLRLP